MSTPDIPSDLIAAHLPRQRWYASRSRPEQVDVVHSEELREASPGLLRLVVDDGNGWWQLLVGTRPAGEFPPWLDGAVEAVLGEAPTPAGPTLLYDACRDPELALVLFGSLVPDERVQRVRLLSGEQSNSSLIYDERIILKVFRRLRQGPNPEVEVTSALASIDFPWVAAAIAVGRDEELDVDLAVAQPFLAGGVDGWRMALTSLRDLFGVHDTQSMPVISADSPPPSTDPSQAGGDFAGEAGRIGEVTAKVHVALAQVFGRHPGDAEEWAADIDKQLERVSHPEVDDGAVREVAARMREVADPGPAIRVHGDLHLGQLLRTDEGWYVLDFEGEPARPLEERRRPRSPLRDVAGMCRSFHYAAMVGLVERRLANDPGLRGAARTWEDRNRKAFLSGYRRIAHPAGLLPGDAASEAAILAGFETEKAVYEVGYEQAHRPDWVEIPLVGLQRVIEEAT